MRRAGWERTAAQPGYRQAKASKRGGRESQKSEPADSTGERGEAAPGDPREGSGRSKQRTFGGTDGPDTGSGDPSHDDKRSRKPTPSERCFEEPDALAAHVRICGSPGPAKARGLPADTEPSNYTGRHQVAVKSKQNGTSNVMSPKCRRRTSRNAAPAWQLSPQAIPECASGRVVDRGKHMNIGAPSVGPVTSSFGIPSPVTPCQRIGRTEPGLAFLRAAPIGVGRQK